MITKSNIFPKKLSYANMPPQIIKQTKFFLERNIIRLDNSLHIKSLKLKSMFLCFLTLFPSPAELFAASPINIHTILLNERLSTTKKLGYNRVLDFILQDVQEDILHTFAPLPRQSLTFQNDTNSCLFPVNE
ncbi:MAG: hypothetical protein ACI9ES_002485 [Oceanospirillaceae bacterium]|jgi:hypothetical protein